MSDDKTCGGCEYSRGTIHSKYLQCHVGFDYQRNKVFQRKTRSYVSGNQKACEHWEKFFDWGKVKLHVKQGSHHEIVGVKWYTETFLFVFFRNKKYELRKAALLHGKTKKFPRSGVEFTLVTDEDGTILAGDGGPYQ